MELIPKTLTQNPTLTRRQFARLSGLVSGASLAALIGLPETARAEQRNDVTFLRGPYNQAYWNRHRASEQYSAGFHYHHGKQHDVLMRTALSDHETVDFNFDRSVFNFVKNRKSRTGPSMELYGPYTAKMAWKLFRCIDWTHVHHEQTYDIMAYQGIKWADKKKWTDRAVRYYQKMMPDVARSVAPLDITMRRAAVMMKPYFTYYRNYYPRSNSQAWVAHWWHPAAYEAQMIGGNDEEQHVATNQVNDTMFNTVYANRPFRMILSRELMPRYAKMSPESANIFDNLHMLHGITYDILAYEGYSPQEKRDELYRVIDAMGYKPGDEKYVRKFSTPYPDVDPRIYYPWMQTFEGEMSRIMREMMEEMMPMMMPGISDGDKETVMAQMRLKMMPGFQDGEKAGSLHDALMEVYPQMKMMPENRVAGKTPQAMVDMMLKGYEEKHGNMPDIEGYAMNEEPNLPPLPSQPALPSEAALPIPNPMSGAAPLPMKTSNSKMKPMTMGDVG